MCQERILYRCNIMQEVPGQNDRFVTIGQVPGTFNAAQATMPLQTFKLAELCNCDRNARIKFALVNIQTNREIQSAVTTLADLEKGQTTLNAGRNCTVVLNNFEVKVRPSFIEYLRSGWEVGLTVAIDYT